jgi:hypothetical protein
MAKSNPIIREHHYWSDTKKHEFWEHSHAVGWRQVSRDIGGDWNGDSYSYLVWREIDGAKSVNGNPPRVFI